MTRVCLIGDADVNLQYELLSRETSREALATYDLDRPFENALAVETVSVGAAVSLLNDLNWYLTRFVETALVQEPSISDDEWLSRPLATALRNGDCSPAETAEFCAVYGLERVEPEGDATRSTEGETPGPNAATSADHEPAAGDAESNAAAEDRSEPEPATDSARSAATPTHRLVEPLYVRRTDGDRPEYDLRDVEETLVVRLTEAEYSP